MTHLDAQTAWPFFPYEKIAESLDAWLGDDEAGYRALRGVPWIASEKIHGANFCFVTDGREIRCAKRKAFLLPGEDFFGHRALLDRLGPSVLRAFSRVVGAEPGIELVYVHGELFGGGYPHPDVLPDPSVEPVQTGCWYSPTIAFCAFDVGVLRGGERTYLDHDEAARVLDEAGILRLEPLLRGSYEEVMALPLGFESTLPAALGLPPLPPGNRAEGVVAKPVRSVAVARRPGVLRPVIKRKIPEFAEDARFHGAEKWPSRAPGAGAAALSVLRYEVSARVTEQRFHAAVSKVGRVSDQARAAEVVALIVDDIDAELGAHHRESLDALGPGEAASLRSFTLGEARALVELHTDIAPAG